MLHVRGLHTLPDQPRAGIRIKPLPRLGHSMVVPYLHLHLYQIKPNIMNHIAKAARAGMYPKSTSELRINDIRFIMELF